MRETFLGDKKIVPMVMFHSIGLENLDWEYNHIAEPVDAFEAKIASLSNAGFNFISWDELYAYMRGELKLRLPAIVLTFDDGYLDNWVYAYPILKKYGAKGTIFVSPDFVDPGSNPRPNIDDVNSGRLKHSDLQTIGFLNWEEMRAMQNSGVIDIQSHAKTHTWYFSGPGVVDFWKPGQKLHSWMAWNSRPERKPYYLNENQWGFIEYGSPVYQHEKSLCVRRYFPSEEIKTELCKYVQDNGGGDYFSSQNAARNLHSLHQKLYSKWESHCYYESEEDTRRRIFNELHEGKITIEQQLGKKVDYICWPGGGYNDLTLELARKAGFVSWTLGSRDQSNIRNQPGSDPVQIKRIGSAPRQKWRTKDLGYTKGWEFVCDVKQHQGSILHKWAKRGLKLLRIAGLMT